MGPDRRHTAAVPENYFDPWIAEHYEDVAAHRYGAELDAAVEFLVDLAGAGPVLELGIGTGRLAVPLAARGIAVHGIELSEAMAARVRAPNVDVTIGDMATTRVDGSFTLVYLVCNTIMNLTTQGAQVACFENAAAHLEPGGHFVVEVIVPPWQWLAPGERFLPFDISPTHLGFDEIDVVTQNSYSHHLWWIDGETKRSSPPFRYVWPSELDLMARIAGMRLHERCADWCRTPFESESRAHVSVWRKT
jgi:SAM-dependent methyltransferase